jgi:hypothetical protein
MLQYLDIAIGFAVIMLGISLLITILNQIISSFLGYRGTNLLWGIKTLLNALEPSLSTEKSEKMATDILKKSLVSGSIFTKYSNEGGVLGWFKGRWKLASAITPQELVRGLISLAETMQTKDNEKPTGDKIIKLLAETSTKTATESAQS